MSLSFKSNRTLTILPCAMVTQSERLGNEKERLFQDAQLIQLVP